jgi:hypothetical protein
VTTNVRSPRQPDGVAGFVARSAKVGKAIQASSRLASDAPDSAWTSQRSWSRH